MYRGKIVELARTGRIKLKELVSHKYPLADINKAFSQLRAGEDSLLRSVVVL